MGLVFVTSCNLSLRQPESRDPVWASPIHGHIICIGAFLPLFPPDFSLSTSEFFDQFRHVAWNLAGELYPFAAGRMDETQHGSMKRLAVEG